MPALADHMKKPPQHLKRSLTWDRGVELTTHKEFTIATYMQVYFCDPHSPWQRGSNENTSGLIRQYFPKCEPIGNHFQEELEEVADELNGRPGKHREHIPRLKNWMNSSVLQSYVDQSSVMLFNGRFVEIINHLK